jgi:NAD(P)H-hydrate epimerase
MANIPVLGQRAAQLLDEALMRKPGFSIDQLMELAGLSVACAIVAVWPIASRLVCFIEVNDFGGKESFCNVFFTR